MLKRRKMGNENSTTRKDNDHYTFSSEVKEKEWNQAYENMLVGAAIKGTTWEELEEKLRNHIEEAVKIEEEWQFLQRKDEVVTRNDSFFAESLRAHNRPKNRYLNILPFDTTRVMLAPLEGAVGSDYINANWVTSGERAYIATQAPVESTVDDFFRMIWQTKAKTLVMLTRLVESERIKAHEYLPKVGETEKHGDIEVTLLSEQTSQDETYIIRQIKLVKNGEQHTVTQFHFLAWPDHGVPEVPEPILDMAITVDKMCPPEPSPTVVHCSAGVGRTGTYIIINSLLEPITKSMENNSGPPVVNMAKTLHDLRTMRAGLVNHFDQYILCYKVILSHIQHLIKQRNEKK